MAGKEVRATGVMRKRNKFKAACPICKRSPANRYIAPALISPWIREMGVKSKKANYIICPECEFGYFDYRYSDEEMSLIYSNYRNSRYVFIRNKWEPWYSEKYNSNHEKPEYVTRRNKIVEEFVSSRVNSSLRNVLDIGGDIGQFIPNFNNANKFILEVSGKKPLAGVRQLSNLDEIENIDLIMYAHVLEHVAHPVEELESFFLRSQNVYVEVPFGLPEINPERKNLKQYYRYYIASHFHSHWRKLASPATGRTVAPKKTLIQSEHINFFTEKSLQVIAARFNLSVTTRVVEVFTPDFQKAKVIQCLFQKP